MPSHFDLEEGSMRKPSILSQLQHSVRGSTYKHYTISRCLRTIFCFVWVFFFILLVHRSTTGAVHPVYGPVKRLSCTSVHWTNANQCGLNGDNCRPFDEETLVYRCPAYCDSSHITNPVFIGDSKVNHRSLVVGGGQLPDFSSGLYRGDSFICAASIHAGVTTRKRGGCGLLIRQGESNSFNSVSRNGIQSVGFDGLFPLSYSLERTGEFDASTGCEDSSAVLLLLTVGFTALFTLTDPSTPSFVTISFLALFFHVAFVSDSPDEPEFSDFNNVVSVTFGRLLPAGFVVQSLYNSVFRKTCSDVAYASSAPLESTKPFCQSYEAFYTSRRMTRLLWLGSTWIGALQNIVFSMIPIPRLTAIDLIEQPHAIPALAVVILAGLLVVYVQYRTIAAKNLVLYYCGLYLRIGTCLLLLYLIPGQNLRLHHYIWPLAVFPITVFPTVQSTMLQGFCLGLFINGTARWGFASILETTTALFPTRSFGSPIPVLQPILDSTTIAFNWAEIPLGWKGIQVIVDDVIRYQGFADENGPISFNWTYQPGIPVYLRACFIAEDVFRGLTTGTCSLPVKVNENGELSGNSFG